ncbi:uncharacterized protein LOC128668867 [Microplitis demolitor]|uniref:uncharacterized protein LOC128668867 n=1 Tax=Microplitis demolitor TaxID=69319 RepID=UPI00235B62C9|nr:uncharacterized protein LOC128668867 [Microplitis demolitor]
MENCDEEDLPINIKSSNLYYNINDIDAALSDIRSGVPLGVTSQKYGIPKTTLHSRVKNKVPIDAKKGPKTFLSTKEENQIVKWIFFLSDRGFPVTKNQLLDSVRDLINELGRKTPFTDNRPGRHWYESFLRQHPDIAKRVVQNLTSVRASVTENSLRNWFKEVEAYLVEKQLIDIPLSRIFNGDESAFQLCPKAEPVITRKGTKAVYKVVNTNDKENITTLFMVSAAGEMVPPMIIYPYQRIPHHVSKHVPKSWFISTSQKGWMTGENFFEYVANGFYPWLMEKKIEFPVILYVDGHSSHLTLPLVNFCRINKIELVALYPNATHILQPLDVAVFHPVKTAWKKTVDGHRIEKNGQSLKKENFAPLLNKALQSMKSLKNTIEHGFKACGLCPFNAEASENVELKPDPNECRRNLEFFEKYFKIDVLKDFEDSERDGFYIEEKIIIEALDETLNNNINVNIEENDEINKSILIFPFNETENINNLPENYEVLKSDVDSQALPTIIDNTCANNLELITCSDKENTSILSIDVNSSKLSVIKDEFLLENPSFNSSSITTTVTTSTTIVTTSTTTAIASSSATVTPTSSATVTSTSSTTAIASSSAIVTAAFSTTETETFSAV